MKDKTKNTAMSEQLQNLIENQTETKWIPLAHYDRVLSWLGKEVV